MLNITTPAGAADHSFADVAERLMAEFAARVDLGTISRVILGCRRDLQGSPVGPCPSWWSASPGSACSGANSSPDDGGAPHSPQPAAARARLGPRPSGSWSRGSGVGAQRPSTTP